MDIIHHVVLSNFPTIQNDKWTSIMIDIIKPKDAKRCFICVDKLLGGYQIGVNSLVDKLDIFCDSVQNSYMYVGRYGNNSIVAMRSNLLDSFSSTVVGTDPKFASFNVINNHENWQEIPIDRLNNLKFSFRSGTIAPLDSEFNLHLKIKFA